ncbi:polysaccharide deacetylase family protein [bacterium]|nr:polysaccharide deacetylase family protein [bacterium]
MIIPAEIPILMYHRVTNTDNKPSTVAVDHFRAQMQYLARHKFYTLTCSQLAEYISRGHLLPAKPVLITFDDGYRNNYEHAFPILQEFNFTATIFLVGNHIGKFNSWETNPSVPRYPLMNRSEIMEMAQTGIEFGSHSMSHKPLNQLSLTEAKKEIVQSKQFLEDLLGKEITSFSYPYNGYTPTIKEFVQESGYTVACTAGSGLRPLVQSRINDLFELRRIIIPYSCKLLEYKLRVSGFYLFFKDLGDKKRWFKKS